MGKIIINQLKLSFQEIKEGRWPEQKPYFEEALLFCREWLSGKGSFNLHTSGSTGVPKPIKVSRNQMISSARATGEFFGIAPGATLLCGLHTAMIAGKMMLVRAMEWGSNIYLVEPSSNPLLYFPANQSFDFAAMVPLQLESSLAQHRSKRMLRRIKNLIIGGAPLSAALRQKSACLPGALYQTYGMTETVSHIALADLKTEGPLVYKVLPGVQIRQSVDSRLEIIAPMSDHQWIITNDVVDIISEKAFVWKGRSDFTINTGGVKIQPEETEAMISGLMETLFPQCRFFISSLPDAQLGQKVILVVESRGKEHQEEVLTQLKALLPPYHAPKALFLVPQFEITDSNKIRRQATLQHLKQDLERF